MKSLIFITLLLFSQYSFSQETDASEVEEFIADGDFSTIDTLSENEEILQKRKWRPPVTKEKRRINIPPKFTGYLKRGSILENINTGKTVFIEKPIFIHAREVSSEGQYSFVFTKKGEMKYRTHTSNITVIDPDLKLYPLVNPNVVYEKKQEFHSEEKSFPLQHALYYEVEAVGTNYYAQIYRGEAKTATATRISWVGYHNTDFNFDFGIMGNYQIGQWNDDVIGRVVWQAFFVGPVTRVSFWKSEKASHAFSFGIEKSLFHKSTKAPDKHSFSTLGLVMGLERVQQTFIGPIKFGATFRRYRQSIKDSTEFLANTFPRSTSTSLGFNIGYQWDLDL